MTPGRSSSRFVRTALLALLVAPLAIACTTGGGSTEPENTAPTATISSPSDGDVFDEGADVTFEGSASDSEDGSLTGSSLVWESDVDGQVGTGASVSTNSLSAGAHTVTLTATDSDGASGQATVSISLNVRPSASISSPADGAAFDGGTSVTFEGSATDAEDGSLTGGSLVWSSDVDGEFGTGESVSTSSLSVTSHTVTLTATDTDGGTGQATVSITIQQVGDAPTASISSPADGSSFDEGTSVTFEGSATDTEDGSLTGGSLVWSSDVDGEIGTGESVSTSSLSVGDHTITLTATDSDNNTAQASISVTVESVGAPSASISSPSDESVFDEGTSVTFEGSATDTEDGSLTGSDLVWSSDVDGQIGTGESVSTSALTGGPHIVTLTATDSDGATGTATVGILVESSGFNIRVRYVSSLTESEKSTVEAGLTPWETAITGDEAPYFPTEDNDTQCNTEQKGIDDLLVVVQVEGIDGSGGTLAQAGPCLARFDGSVFTTAISGTLTIDEADRGNAQLEEIITHEVGHVLGIGIGQLDGWGSNTSGLSGQTLVSYDPYHTGASTVDAFTNHFDGEAYLSDGVPLANTGGSGTAGAHWREVNFDTELMTGFINGGVANPLSRVSLAALVDLGYTVDLSAADAYNLPMPQVAVWTADADATLSEPDSSGVNFGTPDGSLLYETIVVGANNGMWDTDAGNGEVYTGLLRTQHFSRPSGVSITAAELVLEVRDSDESTTGHDVELTEVTASWTEGGVTWDTKPTFAGSPVHTYGFNSCTSCRLSSSGLLSLIQDWANGTTANNGLAFVAPDASGDPTFSVGYRTRHDGDLSLRPRLEVSAEVSSPLRALRAPGGAAGERIPLGNDVRTGLLYGVDESGVVRRVVRIR